MSGWRGKSCVVGKAASMSLSRHPVAGEIEEAHLLARAPHLRGHGVEPAGDLP